MLQPISPFKRKRKLKINRPLLVAYQAVYTMIQVMYRLCATALIVFIVMSVQMISFSGCAIPGQALLMPGEHAESPADAEEEAEYTEEEGEEEEVAEPAAEAQPEAPEKPNLYSVVDDFTAKELVWRGAEGVLLRGDLYSPHGEAELIAAHEAEAKAAAQATSEEYEEEEAYDEEEEGEAPKAPPKREAPAHRYPLVVLMHRLAGATGQTEVLVPELVKQGYAVLVIDARGHGESIERAYGGVVSWRTFDADDWQNMVKDVGQLEHYFSHPERDEAGYPLEVLPGQMAIIAEGLGANAALSHAGASEKGLKALVSIDATLDAKGITPVLPTMESAVPTLFMASSRLPDAFEETQQLHRIAIAKKALRLYDSPKKGVEMLMATEPARKDALRWINIHLPPKALNPKFSAALQKAKAWKKTH